MIPYGLALAAVSMVGHSLGANRPKEAIENCKLIALTTTSLCLIVAMCLNLSATPLIQLYTDDPAVISLVESSYLVFVVSFSFDWMQCCASGLIKGAGFQGVGSLCSLLCLGLVALPVSSVLCFQKDWGIEGLWAGYGLSTMILTVSYYTILTCINWKATAEWAATSEEFSVSGESSEDDV